MSDEPTNGEPNAGILPLVSNFGAVGRVTVEFEPCGAGFPDECLCSVCFSVAERCGCLESPAPFFGAGNAGNAPEAVPVLPAGIGNAEPLEFGEGSAG